MNRLLLDLIGHAEGTDRGRGYNETLGYGAYTGGPVNLTDMTLDEVDQLQGQMLAHPDNPFNSSAAGRYQIVRKTLRGLRQELGLAGDEKYTPELQDALAMHLANRRGADAAGLGEEWQGLRRFSRGDILGAYNAGPVMAYAPEQGLTRSMASNNALPAGFELDAPAKQSASALPAGFELDEAPQAPNPQSRINQAFSNPIMAGERGSQPMADMADQLQLVRQNRELLGGTGAKGAATRGALEGPVLGFFGEIGAGLNAADQFARGVASGEGIGGASERAGRTFSNVQKANEIATALDMEDNPVARVAGEVGGSFVAPVGALGTITATGRAARAGEAALKGAAIGGIAGFGGANGDLDQRIRGAQMGAIGGGLVGGAVGGALGRGAGRASNEVLEAAENIGVQLPRGVASDSKTVQMGFQSAAQAPIGGGKVKASLDRAYEQAEAATGRAADMLAGGLGGDKASIGAGAKEAIGGAIDALDKRAGDAYNTLRKSIDANALVQIPSSSLASLDKIIASRVAAGQEGVPLQGMEAAVNILTRPEGVSFNGLQRARTEIGKQISWDARNGGFMQGDLKQVYGLLSDAMDYAVQRTARGNPDEASRLLSVANKRFGETIAETKELRRVLGRNGSDEGVVNKILGYANERTGNLKQLDALQKAIGPEEWGRVGGYLVEQMGIRKGEFSPATFRTNYEKLSEQGRNRLFGAQGTGTRQFIDDINTVAERLEKTSRFANFSNTGRAVLGGYGLYNLKDDPYGTIGGTVGMGTLALILSRPATAASAAKWSRAYELVVRKPSAATLSGFNIASRNFGATITDKLGIPVPANDIGNALVGALQGPRKAAAENDDTAAAGRDLGQGMTVNLPMPRHYQSP